MWTGNRVHCALIGCSVSMPSSIFITLRLTVKGVPQAWGFSGGTPSLACLPRGS